MLTANGGIIGTSLTLRWGRGRLARLVRPTFELHVPITTFLPYPTDGIAHSAVQSHPVGELEQEVELLPGVGRGVHARHHVHDGALDDGCEEEERLEDLREGREVPLLCHHHPPAGSNGTRRDPQLCVELLVVGYEAACLHGLHRGVQHNPCVAEIVAALIGIRHGGRDKGLSIGNVSVAHIKAWVRKIHFEPTIFGVECHPSACNGPILFLRVCFEHGLAQTARGTAHVEETADDDVCVLLQNGHQRLLVMVGVVPRATQLEVGSCVAVSVLPTFEFECRELAVRGQCFEQRVVIFSHGVLCLE
eukprot:PhM_4_TR5387/c0_g1_i2/m.11414